MLLYAHFEVYREHEAARRWLEGVLARREALRLAWMAILGFLRIGTDARVFRAPLPAEAAIRRGDALLQSPAVAILQPTARHWSILQQMLTEGQAKGPLTSDAHLAALAIEHGATLATTDRDFSRFPGLKWVNPLR